MCDCEDRKKTLNKSIQALHCPTRWDIIRFIGKGKKSTKDIQAFLTKNDECVTPSKVYYHLSELKKAGIIDVAEYKEEGGGAPDKVWKLKKTSIVINLLDKK